MQISCQFLLCPLRIENLGPVLREALEELDALDIHYTVGRMSTSLEGEEEKVFTALARAFHRVAREREVILTATVSNACQ